MGSPLEVLREIGRQAAERGETVTAIDACATRYPGSDGQRHYCARPEGHAGYHFPAPQPGDAGFYYTPGHDAR